MLTKKSRGKSCLYNRKRYWYHISSTLNRKYHKLVPWDNERGFNRCSCEPNIARICVAPSIAHCFTAVPYCTGDTYNVYRTKQKVKADKPHDVFDANVTREEWLHVPTAFVKLGIINFEMIEMDKNIERVIEDAASKDDNKYSSKVLRWWKKIKFER